MPGSSGEHLVLMSREGEVIPRSPAFPHPFFSFLLFLRGRASYCDPHISAAVCSADIKTFGESEDKLADSLLPIRNCCPTKPNSFFLIQTIKKSRKTCENHIVPASREKKDLISFKGNTNTRLQYTQDVLALYSSTLNFKRNRDHDIKGSLRVFTSLLGEQCRIHGRFFIRSP